MSHAETHRDLTMSNTKNSTLDLAVPFDVRDLIFSTTDRKGIIRSVNDTFLEMARYSLDEVLGKPHNLVRHPHMPKAGFALYWDYISRGQSIGVYVTNRASDGAYYKVYTLATLFLAALLCVETLVVQRVGLGDPDLGEGEVPPRAVRRAVGRVRVDAPQRRRRAVCREALGHRALDVGRFGPCRALLVVGAHLGLHVLVVAHHLDGEVGLSAA